MTTPYAAVSTIMSWPVAAVDHETSLQEAVEALAAEDVGIVLVLGKGSLVGVVSERDVVAHVAAGTDLTHLTVGEVMATDVVVTSMTASVLDAARAMTEADVRHLPVMEGELLAGVVSARDVLPLLVDAVDGDVVVVPSGTRVVVSGS
jgi:CBS domain-containing protein